MPIEDREDYVDLVAQAVIDKIEERDRLAGVVEMVAHRVMELQEQKQAALKTASDASEKEIQNAGERNHAY